MGTSVPVRPTKYCHACAGVIDQMAVVCPKCGVMQPAPVIAGQSEKRILPAAILCFMFGVFGAHRFYVGKTGTAIAQILTLGGLGIWAMIDLIMILTGTFTDEDGNRLTEWT